jgi:hypothetical protein
MHWLNAPTTPKSSVNGRADTFPPLVGFLLPSPVVSATARRFLVESSGVVMSENKNSCCRHKKAIPAAFCFSQHKWVSIFHLRCEMLPTERWISSAGLCALHSHILAAIWAIGREWLCPFFWLVIECWPAGLGIFQWAPKGQWAQQIGQNVEAFNSPERSNRGNNLLDNQPFYSFGAEWSSEKRKGEAFVFFFVCFLVQPWDASPWTHSAD